MKNKSLRAVAATTASIVVLALTSSAPAHPGQSIPDQINAITARSVVAGNSWSMYVTDPTGNITYYQKNSATGEAPASNMKIMTSSAAFGLLGITNAFVTEVYGNGTISGGTLSGDINLVVYHDITWNESVFGTGNAIAPLNYIAAQLKSQGITKVTGKIQVYGACMYDRADTDDTRDIQNQATYNAAGATAFKTALKTAGITARGQSAGVAGFSAPGTLIYTYYSTNLTYNGAPLELDVACIPMAKVSHNVMADLLLRHISYELTGVDGFTNGAAQVFGWLKNTVGLSTNGMVMEDGSGLSHNDRMTAKEMVTVTRFMCTNYSTWPTILPIGCVDGTLSSRFCGTDGSGHVHAKTGSLSISIDLSGYVDNRYNGHRYYFSFLVNNSAGIDQTDTRQALDDAVNSFSGVPPTVVDSYAGNDGNGSVDLVMPDAANMTAMDAENGANGSFLGWTNIAGSPTGSGSTPVIGYEANQKERLFLRGADNNVWTVVKALNGAWGSWSSLGGNIQGSVSVGYETNGAITIFAHSSSNTVITCSESGPSGTFGSWSDLGGQCYDDPLFAANTDGRFQIFTRSATDTVQSNYKTSAGVWHGWTDYGGSCIGKPQGGQWTNGVIVVFTRTASNTVHVITQNSPNGSWSSWSDLGGSAYSDPAVTYNEDGRMQFFVQTASHTVALNFRLGLGTNSSWYGWIDMGGSSYTNLGVGDNADGTIHVFARDNNYVVQSSWQTNANSSFTGWSSLGGNTPAVSITTQPASQTVTAGTDAPFSVVAANALTYQWRFNGADIAGATTSTYTVVAAQGTDAGSYSVVVANNAGSVTSADAVLTVSGAGPLFATRLNSTSSTSTSSTSPSSSTSTKRSTESGTADGNVTLPRNSVWARVYQVQYSEGFGSRWINLGHPVIANGDSITVNDDAPGHAWRTYRAIAIQ